MRAFSGRAIVAIPLFSVAALIMDGFDQQLLPLTAPLILREWPISHSQIGSALVAALIGMMLGTIVGGMAGDRFGRRGMIVGSTAFFGAATLLISISTQPAHLVALRLLGGFAFGAVVPNTIAMVSTSVSPTVRVRIISLLTVCVPVGATLGALFVSWLLTFAGWRVAFQAGGSVSIGLSVLMLAFLPRGSQREKIEGAVASARAVGRNSVVLTLGVWFAFFASGYVVYAVSNWMAVILVEHGFNAAAASSALFFFISANVVGSLLAAVLIERISDAGAGLTAALATVLSAALLMALILRQDSRHDMILVALTALGLAAGTLQTSCYVMAASNCAAERSATSIGVAVGINRLGGIIAIGAGGLLLEHGVNGNAAQLLSICAVPVLAVIGVLAVRLQRTSPLHQNEAPVGSRNCQSSE